MQHALAYAALALTLSGAALAQQPEESLRTSDTGQTVWERMEQHGRITVSDIRDQASMAFRALDADGNGAVSRPEMVNEKLPKELGRIVDDPKLRQQLFDRIDSDGNGKISRDEWQGALNRDLGAADLDQDGRITLSELSRVDASSAFLNMLGF